MQFHEEQNVGETVEDRETEQGFTPGPWRAERTSIGYTIKADDMAGPKNGIGLPAFSIQFAKIWETDPNGEAPLPFHGNARLIAAAPALYEVALRAADYLCADRPSACSQTRIDTPHCVSCLARAALALVNKPDTNSANSIHPAHGQASKTEVQK